MSGAAFGARSLIPDEMLEAFGEDALLPDGHITRPGLPLIGRVERNAGYPSPAAIALFLHDADDSLLRGQSRRLLLWQHAYDTVMNGVGRVDQEDFPNPLFLFRWRPQGSLVAWTEIPGNYLGVSFNSIPSVITEGNRSLEVLGIEDRRVDPTDAQFDATAAALPTEGQYVEFQLLGPITPDPQHPVVVEGITAGEYARNCYLGLYSSRDPVTGAVVPTGIKYDEAALLQMTELVRMRLASPVADVRDHLEKMIYGPTGWAPALDHDGRISPVSQIPPSDTSGLYVLDNANAEPSPDWNAGETIYNIIRFKYPRFYSEGPPDPPPQFTAIPRQNVVGRVDLEFEFRDEGSIGRHGEQVLEFDGSMFGAIGLEPADEENVLPMRFPGENLYAFMRRHKAARYATQTPVVVSGVHVTPITGDIADETGYQLAQDRGNYLLARYSLGAPTMRFNVRRETVPELRAGDWVLLNLTHLPDYVTERRGLIGLGQVVGLAHLDCAWDRVTVEQVFEAGS